MIRRFTALAAAALLGTLSLVFVASPAQAAYGWAVYSQSPGYCLLARNNSLAIGAQIVSGGPECDRYDWFPSRAGWYHIKNLDNPSLCLTVKSASKVNNAPIIQHPCNPTLNSEWLMVQMASSGGRDYYQWRNRNSQKCMNVPNSSTTPGTILVQYTCNNTARGNLFTWIPWNQS